MSAHVGVLLTRAEFDRIVAEREALRSTHRDRVADHDDQLAPFEDALVVEVKIQQLERLIASSTVIDETDAADGAAGLGSVVLVEEAGGRRAEYELVGVRAADAGAGCNQVTPASPMGEALLGARPGDTLRVVPPSGRVRSLTVVAVTGTPATAMPART